MLLHTDAAQVLGKRRVDVEDLGVDFLTIVGHKVGVQHSPNPGRGGASSMERHPAVSQGRQDKCTAALRQGSLRPWLVGATGPHEAKGSPVLFPASKT